MLLTAAALATNAAKTPDEMAALMENLASVSGRTLAVIGKGHPETVNELVEGFCAHVMEEAVAFSGPAVKIATLRK
jgi:hypothetical protein